MNIDVTAITHERGEELDAVLSKEWDLLNIQAQFDETCTTVNAVIKRMTQYCNDVNEVAIVCFKIGIMLDPQNFKQ